MQIETQRLKNKVIKTHEPKKCLTQELIQRFWQRNKNILKNSSKINLLRGPANLKCIHYRKHTL
jgi:hypothetical protein